MSQEIQYIGEHLWPGRIGHLFIILAFTSAIFSAIAYSRATKAKSGNASWNTLGRIGYYTHGLAVFTIIGLIFYMMTSKMYEYSYVQQHVSDDLPMKYILSAFWEGQEGSFLLWMFWHVILGFVLIRTAKTWEAPVLIFVALVEAIMASMLLGIHIEFGDFLYKVGSNPMVLLRDVIAAPIFEKADYLTSIQGTGLNPLLQNYWNTIHPPTTFLGFASTTIPFAFAAAGLYTGRHSEWIRPALKWALFSGGILGVGILMGSAWAYEALTFGGYWAWDPVENMSFVPWLILVAGIHTNLVARSTGRAIRSTYIYYCLSFVLVIYSTYLTRSGILGDTSAHAFTEMGLEPQLIFLVGFFAILSLALYIKGSRAIAVHKKEESIYSREFWMFVGALVLLFSGLIIAGSTSLPVMNKIISLSDPEFTGKVIKDPIPHYNKFQLWIAMLVMVLSAKVIFLRYKTSDWSNKQKLSFVKSQTIHAGIAAILTFLFSLWIDYFHWKYMLLAFSAFYTIVSNSHYLVSVAKFNTKMAAAVLSHAGFGVMILGILTSGLNEDVLTTNPFAMKGLMNESDLATSVKLIKNEPFYVNEHWITYESDTVIGKMRTYKVKIEREDSLKGNVDPYYVYPNVLYSNDQTKIAATNPSTKHFLTKDIFTSIVSLPKSQQDIKFAQEQEDSLKYVQYQLNIGDTLFTKYNYAIIEGIHFNPTHADYLSHNNDIGLAVDLSFRSLEDDDVQAVETSIGVRDNLLYQYPAQVDDLGVKLRLNETSFDNYFTTEEKLEYVSYEVTRGGEITFQGETFVLTGFEQPIVSDIYKSEPDDIALQAILKSKSRDFILKPIYIIRDTKPFNIKDYNSEAGLHARVVHIDPVKETFNFAIAADDRSQTDIVIEIAENVPRSDIIVLEAKIFPGINLFWLGACVMLAGFFLSLWHRRKVRA